MSIFISDIRNNKNELEKKPTIAICSNLLRLYICAFTANLYSISQVLRHQNNIFLNKKKNFLSIPEMVRILQNPSGQLQMKIVEWNDMTN